MTALDLEPSTGADKYDRQSLFMKKVTRLALQYEVLVILVAHKRKNDGSSNTNDNVSGSADIANLASIVLSYERNPDDGNSRLLKVTKNRLFGKTITDGFWMKYDDNSKRIYMNDQERDRVYGWNNPINEEPEEEKLPWD
jgi:RecA-family ATPase